MVASGSRQTRTNLVRILHEDNDLHVVAEARTGSEAVEMAKKFRPNVVVLDIELSHMDGLQTSKQIMVEVPTPIVVISGNTEAEQVSASVKALQAGALAVVLRPTEHNDPRAAIVNSHLLKAVKSMSQVKVVRHRHANIKIPTNDLSSKSTLLANSSRVRIIAIAASVGGPPALSRVLSELPASFPTPILVVQHLAKGFVDGLATWLDGLTPLRVKVANANELLAPQTVYIAPDNYHLGVANASTIFLSSDPAIGGFRPSSNYLFESVAKNFGASSIAVILTGMGDDGVQGLVAIKQAGGRIVAQDEETCVVFGMPGAAVARKLVQNILPIGSIPAHLKLLVDTEIET